LHRQHLRDRPIDRDGLDLLQKRRRLKQIVLRRFEVRLDQLADVAEPGFLGSSTMPSDGRTTAAFLLDIPQADRPDLQVSTFSNAATARATGRSGGPAGLSAAAPRRTRRTTTFCTKPTAS